MLHVACYHACATINLKPEGSRVTILKWLVMANHAHTRWQHGGQLGWGRRGGGGCGRPQQSPRRRPGQSSSIPANAAALPWMLRQLCWHLSLYAHTRTLLSIYLYILPSITNKNVCVCVCV